MFYQKQENERGNFIDSEGVRYSLTECKCALTPQGMNVGYTEFESREACLEAWGLTELSEEEMQELDNPPQATTFNMLQSVPTPGVMLYYRIEKTDGSLGDVKDAEGNLYILCETGAAFSAAGKNIGYTQFPSREACLSAWNLTELTEEEMFPPSESIPEEEMIDLQTEEEQI